MEMVPDHETEGFSFVWTIRNFSYCLLHKGEHLYSPRFKLNLSDANEWRLYIHSKGNKSCDTIGVYLELFSGPLPIKVINYISIRATNGTFLINKMEDVSFTFKSYVGWGQPCFLTYSELYKNEDAALMENDTLTLRCRIQKEYPELPLVAQCNVLTIIDVKRISFVWHLENFKEILHSGKKNIKFHANSSPIQFFIIYIYLSGGVYSERKIQIEISRVAPVQKQFITCKLSLLKADGKTAQSVFDEYWFEASESTQNWHFTFLPVQKILDNEELYLVNGALSLRLVLAVSSGEKFDIIEGSEYGVFEKHDTVCCSKTVDTDFPGSLKDNWQRFYKECKFSDLTIRTASSKDFPVHKAVLCARSEVFNAMFEHDTKENRTGVVEIKDLNDGTVSKMLQFTYTDIVEDLEWQAASELYFAADKYGIVALKRECSNFLKGNLNSSNVCELLVLADMHQDLDLKSSAQDFVNDHATEIINSEYWKKFIKDKPNLAAETMQILCMRNFKI